MIQYTEIETWADLLEALKQASPEQLAQPVQTAKGHPVDEYVHGLCPGLAIATVDQLGLRYARSSSDNRRHGEHLVIFVDGPPFGIEGAFAYEWVSGQPDKPIYTKDHDDGMNWTGPAQKLADAETREESHGTLGSVLAHRMKSYDEASE